MSTYEGSAGFPQVMGWSETDELARRSAEATGLKAVDVEGQLAMSATESAMHAARVAGALFAPQKAAVTVDETLARIDAVLSEYDEAAEGNA